MINGKIKSTKKVSKIPEKYIPKEKLTLQQQAKQKKAIEKSKKAYSEGRYVERPKIKGYKSKKSSYTREAERRGISGSIKHIAEKITKTESRRKQVEKGLREIMKKGRGAYFSSGSRPNTTPTQWGKARIYSVLFGGKARQVDKKIVDEYNIPKL